MSDTTPPSVPAGSDLARLAAFLDSVEYVKKEKLQEGDTGKTYVIDHEPGGIPPDPRRQRGLSSAWYWSLALPQGIGYGNFYCDFYFDAEGRLLHHGVWE